MADFILGRLKFTFQGEWDNATAYIKDDIVNYNGTGWVCKANHTSTSSFPEDRDDGNWEAITTGLNYRGTWDVATVYELNDIVQWAGSTWISVVNTNEGIEPTPVSSTDWDLLVQGDADSILENKGDIIYRTEVAATVLPIGVEHAVLQVNSSGVPSWNRNITGADDVTLTGQLYAGNGAPAQATTDGLTGLTATFLNDVDEFAQVAVKNKSDGSSASTDVIAYADNGDNDNGWIDMGITSSTFDDPTFGVTGINDGYIFMSAPLGTTGNGNLYISTSGEGVQNDIVFSTGGFEDSSYERMRIVGVAHGTYNAGINLVDDVSTTNGKFYIGPDAKDLTIDGTTATTQLNGGINSTATTITVDSTTGFNTKGYITINDEVIFYGGKTATTFTNCNRGYSGTTAASHADNDSVVQVTYVGLTNATAIFTGDADDFVQFSIKNTNSGSSASTDLIAYASDGDNDSGWIDLGITSSTYSDPAFTVTGPGTGYLFFSAPATTTGTGDLLIGTDHTGSNNDIVFFTNGFDAGNERLRIVGQGVNAGVEVYADTESTSTTTGALRVDGGIGLQGNLYVGGDVNIVGNITLGGTGNTVETESLAVADPIIRMANGNTTSDLLDIGFVGTYASSGTKYTGLIRDASDSTYKLFTGLTTNPTTTVDFTGASYAGLKAGSLELTATTASSSTSSGALIVPGGAGIAGAVYVGSTLNVASTVGSAGVTSTGTVAVNASGGITTNQTTFPLVNTTATTVNFAGAATSVNIGASTGTTTINNGLTVAKQTTLAQISEVLNTKTGATSTVVHDYSTGDVWYHSSISSNFGVNLTNVPTTADRTISIVLFLNQGSTGYLPNEFFIDSASQTIRWVGNTVPTASTNKFDIVSFTLVRTGGTWFVFGQLTAYA